MILADKDSLKYLHAYKDGRIKQGLKIGCHLDNHFVFKRAEFNMVLGLDNVGKTTWLLWYLLCHAKLNGKKFIIWSGENRAGQLKRDLIQMWLGIKFKDIIKSKIELCIIFLLGISTFTLFEIIGPIIISTSIIVSALYYFLFRNRLS